MFAKGEDYEFKQKDYAKAVVNFRGLAHSPDPEIRVGALLRLARNLRKAGQPLDALVPQGVDTPPALVHYVLN